MRDPVKVIRLEKQLGKLPENYMSNLQELVNDLSKTSFWARKVRLFNESFPSLPSPSYNIYYGTKEAKDKTGVPVVRNKGWKDIELDKLFILRRYIDGAFVCDDPDFQIQYRERMSYELSDLLTYGLRTKPSEKPLSRITKIEMQNLNTSTYLAGRLFKDGMVWIVFNYDIRSYNRELRKVKASVSTLLERGYKAQENAMANYNNLPLTFGEITFNVIMNVVGRSFRGKSPRGYL